MKFGKRLAVAGHGDCHVDVDLEMVTYATVDAEGVKGLAVKVLL